MEKIGYYISKGKCLRAYAVKKLNKRTNKMKVKKVNYKGKAIRKGTKIYKRKADCIKKIKPPQNKKPKPVKKPKQDKKQKSKPVKKQKSKFGQSCAYSVPYFGNMVPTTAKFVSGTPSTGMTSTAWAWPTPPSALNYDKQQGGWLKARM